MSDTSDSVWPSPDAREEARRQAQELYERAREGGLRFQAYLPPVIALWLLDHVENGTFHDPSEAAFVLFREAKELEPHADLRGELLKRMTSEIVANHHIWRRCVDLKSVKQHVEWVFHGMWPPVPRACGQSFHDMWPPP